MELSREFLKQSIHYMELNLPRITHCLERLNEEEIWQRPNASSNSVGNLILHLCGNITQYILSGLGGKIDERQRDTEFDIRGGIDKPALLSKIVGVIQKATQVISQVDDKVLTSKRIVQGFEMTGFAIIIHVVEHLSYHTGQIAFWTKLLKDQDLGFYNGINLNAKNQ